MSHVVKMRSLYATLFAAILNIKFISAVDSLRFMMIGDMGGIDIEPYSTYYERCTAREMGHIADMYAPQFVLELGDNFYMDGVKSVDDDRFKSTFERVFSAPSLQVPWYFVAGNHDHHSNVTAQLLYSNNSKRWNFPSLYYYKEFPISEKNHTLGIIFIDTVVLCGGTDGKLIGSQPVGPEDVGAAEKQWAFIEEKLRTSRATYLFAAGHYPIYSTATHGPTKCLVDRLKPLLNKYGANGYFCGHDHNLQHLREKDTTTGVVLDYIVNGMANFVDPFAFHKASVPPGSELYQYGWILSRGGFVYAETTSNNMSVTFINGHGTQLYKNVIRPRKKPFW